MNDFTKIKLINSLIDVVTKFYELKNSNTSEDATHLKGFCEGMAYTLIQLDYLSKDEASKILKGLGKKLEIEEACMEIPPQEEGFSMQKSREDRSKNLDIPTFLRKK